jgi:acetyl esterase/lipase
MSTKFYSAEFLASMASDTATYQHFLASSIWTLDGSDQLAGAFEVDTSNGIENAVVTSVERAVLFGYRPAHDNKRKNGRTILILSGGDYAQLMVGTGCFPVANWLTSLGFNAFMLVHRLPNSNFGPQAPLDDARRALCMLEEKGFAQYGLGVYGFSSGGHLGAALLADYPKIWTSPPLSAAIPQIKFAIIGYGPISTNATGRTVVPDKAALEPPERQNLYDVLQPDVQIRNAPPTFFVFSGNDSAVPVINAYRLAGAITEAGALVELHVFADAPHGIDLSTVGLPASRWPQLCEAWLRQNKLLRV